MQNNNFSQFTEQTKVDRILIIIIYYKGWLITSYIHNNYMYYSHINRTTGICCVSTESRSVMNLTIHWLFNYASPISCTIIHVQARRDKKLCDQTVHVS